MGSIMQQKRILIVGAGITGVSTALWLQRDGWATTLIDPIRPGSSGQTSFGNAGLLARASLMPVATSALMRKAPAMLLNPDAPLFLRWSYLPRLLPWLAAFIRNVSETRIREIAQGLTAMTADTNEQHLALAQGSIAARHIRQDSLLTLYPERRDYEADSLTIALRKEYGFVPDILNRAEIVERDPHLGPSYNFATKFGDYCWIASPGDYVSDLFQLYLDRGGEFLRARVTGLATGEKPAATLESGDILDAEKIVLAAGVWSRDLAKTLGIRMVMEAERGYHLSIKNPAFTAPQPYMVTDAKLVVTPMQGALRAAGIVEFAGIDAPAKDAPIRLIKRAMGKLYPGLEIGETESWMGRRPTTADSLPVLGEAASAPNIIHAYGGQHLGLTIGPKLGRLVADLIGGRRPNIDLAPYRPDRF